MPGLVPGIHVFLPQRQKQDVDGRDEPGHDDAGDNRFLFTQPLSRDDLIIQGENSAHPANGARPEPNRF
jgi:hypothetical protein